MFELKRNEVKFQLAGHLMRKVAEHLVIGFGKIWKERDSEAEIKSEFLNLLSKSD